MFIVEKIEETVYIKVDSTENLVQCGSVINIETSDHQGVLTFLSMAEIGDSLRIADYQGLTYDVVLENYTIVNKRKNEWKIIFNDLFTK